MKTAMQQLRQMINDKLPECSETRKYTFIQVLELIDIAEIIEQEQIETAFDDSSDEYSKGLTGECILYGKDYYKQKFNND